MTTGLYAALLIMLFIVLSFRVIQGRQKYKVALGDGDQQPMRQLMRSHANFSEYTPLFLISLGLVDYNGLPPYAVHGLGSAFLVGRLLHAYGVGVKERIVDGQLKHIKYRQYAMLLTFVTLAINSVILVVQYGLSIWAVH
ncbi:MAPEG family protein [Cohaesibacter celericrescens]|uniref:Glutathione metabolism protein n=1 Tax=Cohaesibacter celericrescens TaxID=2067669 RepID=A0A2N5XR88_9HYPH|nr:MAPEG family protein [Cohaesibacter celericrescens]PLW77036.1 glutathione metabolism protein [Cohaesibacter celericrescens]